MEDRSWPISQKAYDQPEWMGYRQKGTTYLFGIWCRQPDWTGYRQKDGKGTTYLFGIWCRQPDWTGYRQMKGNGTTYLFENVIQTT
ncbi:hypothetical protein B1A99_34560 [Cohnella sp. CIP 111063]|nr:hypothetical protein B1A99_34560 [Cohnella sp. CIP 111063]